MNGNDFPSDRPVRADAKMGRRSASIIPRFRASGALFLLLALFPTGAAAECQAWQLLRTFNAVQANGYYVVFELGEVFNGKTKGSAHYYTGSDFHRVTGKADASFDGHVLKVSVWWLDKSYGSYTGHIDDGGNLAGLTKNLQNPTGAPNPEVYWHSKQKFKCGLEPIVGPKQVKKLGRPH